MLSRQPGILLLAILFVAVACSHHVQNEKTAATSAPAPLSLPASAEVIDSENTATTRASTEPDINDQEKMPEASAQSASVNQKPPESAPTPTVMNPPEPATPVKENLIVASPAPVKPKPVAMGRLEGRVQILGKKNKKHKPSNVIITLKPFTAVQDTSEKNRTHEVDMRNKTYTPVAQTILKGDSLQFNNHDDIKHNVFSSSGDNTFDLGTFEGGGVRTVALQHTGIVKVYCNIHPEMATFVMVADNPLHAISNNKGEFVIENIPTGKYALSLWHIRGESNTEVVIEAGVNSLQELLIDASSYQRVAHKNKFGEEYEKKPALFEDEFY